MKRWRRWALGALLGLSAISVCAQAAPEALPQLRIGFQKSSINLLVARKLGLVERHLPGTALRWTEFPAGPQLLEALGAGSIDFGMTGDTPPVFAQAAAGSELRYVGVEPPKPGCSAIVVAPDSPLHTLADLKGKRVAFQKGSSAHYLVLEALAHAGLNYSDIQPVYLAPADARAAFEKGSVDAWAIWDPYWAAAEQGTATRTLANGVGLSDNNTFYLSTQSFAAAHATVLSALYAALDDADDYVSAHPEDAVALIAEATGLPAEVARRFLQRRPPSPVAPLSPTIISHQQQLADAYVHAGLIPHEIRVADAVWAPPATLSDKEKTP